MKGEVIMKNILRKGAIIISIYLIFTVYLLCASERFERLEENDESLEKVNVTIKYSE